MTAATSPTTAGNAAKRPRVSTAAIVIGAELVAIVASFCVAPLHEAALHNVAANAVKDMKQVSDAATAVHAKLGQWPEDGTPGEAPKSLEPFLPQRLSFDRGAYQLDWDHWDLNDPNAYADNSEFAAVSVTSRDPRLVGLIIQQLDAERVHFTVGNRAFVVVSAPGIGAP